MAVLKSTLCLALFVTALAGAGMLAGCTQPASSTTTAEQVTPPPPPPAPAPQYRR
jgi:hypothetical protein